MENIDIISFLPYATFITGWRLTPQTILEKYVLPRMEKKKKYGSQLNYKTFSKGISTSDKPNAQILNCIFYPPNI